MDELTIDGKIYLSSKRAAVVTGYAKDYVGQLCREGRVEAKLVGRSWYVYEPSIMKHRFDGEEAIEEVKPNKKDKIADPEDISVNISKEDFDDKSSDITNKYNIIDDVTYKHDTPEEIPIAEIEESWKKWFSSPESSVNAETYLEKDEIQEKNEEGAVPLTILRNTDTHVRPILLAEITPVRQRRPR